MTTQFAELTFRQLMTLGSGQSVERAEVAFPNGWGLSILRGMNPLHHSGALDFETCRLLQGRPQPSSATRHRTIEDVQREMDAVAALSLTASGKEYDCMSEPVSPDAAELATRIEQLVTDAREAGFSDEATIAALSEAVEALKEGLS